MIAKNSSQEAWRVERATTRHRVFCNMVWGGGGEGGRGGEIA